MIVWMLDYIATAMRSGLCLEFECDIIIKLFRDRVELLVRALIWEVYVVESLVDCRLLYLFELHVFLGFLLQLLDFSLGGLTGLFHLVHQEQLIIRAL